jgi:acyl-CoA reductase-like NAD-dependent aldehyde dehydrogenase
MLENVNVGDPQAPATCHGAQASQVQLDKILGYLELGHQEGAHTLTGGKRANVAGLPEGLFIQPTLLVDVKNEMRIAQEEIFGPVTSVITFDDEDEVVRMANDTVYGLGGGVWTQNLARAHRIACALDTGTVWVNQYYNFIPGMPIGGYKQSGFGREFAHEVLNHYTLTKSVVINLRSGPLGMFAR